MRDNIDLTKNRDFGRRRGKRFFIPFLKKYPWFYEKTVYSKEGEVVHTGTKKERRYKKNFELYQAKKCCERCGINLSSKPWLMGEYLCFCCEKAMERDQKIEDSLILLKKR